ncbi:MAG: guanylate kinase [Elusimicrobiota bacterium]|nr:guanylate kinase [Elusimicrobiota bacterium]
MKLLQRYVRQYKNKIKKGKVVVISAPSGSGKTTICKELLKCNPNLVFSISYTTRPAREGEVNGKDYFFVSKDEFLKMVKKKKFVEWAKVYNNYYGTSKEQIVNAINSGKDILLDIDVQGGKNIKKLFPDGIFIFVLPPSWSELKQRITSRGKDTPAEISKRLRNVNKELSYLRYYDYIVINDDLADTVKIINTIISAGKYRNILN